MVHGFVKQSQGHIKIYSEPGEGTTVKLYLPRAGRAGTAQTGTRAGGGGRGTETVLLVEDNDLVRTYAEEQLQALGYRVLVARTSAEALALADRDASIDLLFTDIIMPGGMNGRKLAEAIRQVRPAIRVLYTSGYTENAIIHHGRLDPGVHLLNKPYSRADLAAKLRVVLGASHEP
jgi:CheY-like chemotaxis protein